MVLNFSLKIVVCYGVYCCILVDNMFKYNIIKLFN